MIRLIIENKCLMPVFANRKKAEKFSKRRGNAEIIEGIKKEAE